eukprot:TRINITY_DN1813_c0_g1_i2.p1 TRINITY_DN1813_c0_g1~~TRINITY_DN1813_c0_g1_i2.p1  ORF type:complete len:462 (-),score=85.98 TRINITY_DN1813_c0_g1_i2:214-1599(-)
MSSRHSWAVQTVHFKMDGFPFNCVYEVLLQGNFSVNELLALSLISKKFYQVISQNLSRLIYVEPPPQDMLSTSPKFWNLIQQIERRQRSSRYETRTLRRPSDEFQLIWQPQRSPRVRRFFSKRLRDEDKAQSLLWSNRTKMVMLGTAQVGKTTFFKQVRRFCAETTTEDRKAWKYRVYDDVIFRYNEFRILDDAVYQRSESGQMIKACESARIDSGLELSDRLSDFRQHVKNHLIPSWHKLLALNEVQIMDCVHQDASALQYYCHSIDRITREDYVPNDLDIAMHKARTCGIIEADIKHNDQIVTLVDTGGERPERRKWQIATENANSILYFVALSNFEVPSDSKLDKLSESLRVFETLVRRHPTLPFFLIFTMEDLLKDRVPRNRASVWPCYFQQGVPKTFEKAKEAIIESFKRVHQSFGLSADLLRFSALSTLDEEAVINTFRTAISWTNQHRSSNSES